MIPAFAKAFTYRIHWHSRAFHSGVHRGVQGGLGHEFRGNLPLIDYPDARRIDISQTIRDPGGQVHVRIFNQKTPAAIYAVCDLSASMQFRGDAGKMALAAEIAASIAYSAYQAGDPFGFVGFDRVVREDWSTRPSRRMHEAFELIGRLQLEQAGQAGADGLLDAGRYLGASRSLVFLISDFHMPTDTLERALSSLSRHHVVPLVLWDSAEYRTLPDFGIATIVDPESGRQRTLFFRDALCRKFLAAFEMRREKLKRIFMQYEAPALFVEDRFEAEAVSEYFQQFSAL